MVDYVFNYTALNKKGRAIVARPNLVKVNI